MGGFRLWPLLVVVLALAGAQGSRAASTSRIVFAANRLPQFYGEIYRVDATGHRIDLSKSGAADVGPAVSPNGKLVAFVSGREPRAAVYIVGIDGRGLRRISHPLFRGITNLNAAEIAWSPNSRQLVVDISTPQPINPGLYLADVDGNWKRISSAVNMTLAAWSPDGRYFAYATNFGQVNVATSAGRAVWSAPGNGPASWGAGDRLAVEVDGAKVAVYNLRGRKIDGYAASSFVWSPNGELFASTTSDRLAVRKGALGRPFRDAVVGRNATLLDWAGASRLRIDTGNGYAGYDVATAKPWRLTGLAATYGSVVSGSSVAAGTSPYAGHGFAPQVKLERSALNSTAVRTLATAPPCGDETVYSNLQFTPSGRYLVYQSGCDSPQAAIYSVAPDGTSPERLTHSPADDTEPMLSQDGSTVVYVQQDSAAACKGCPTALWRVPAGGGAPTQLTSPAYNSTEPYDDHPSWSPDGTEIAFIQSSAVSLSLATMPAAGGAVERLGIRAESPVWGPKLIAYLAWKGDNTYAIATLDPTTGATRTLARLTYPKDNPDELTWIGDRVAYLDQALDGTCSIHIVGQSTSIELQGLVPNGAAIAFAGSPDGKQFAFVAVDSNGVGEVYTINADGTGLTQITHGIGAVPDRISWR